MSLRSKPMKVAMISARYMDQHAIESYLLQIFGYGQAYVTVSFCALHVSTSLKTHSSVVSKRVLPLHDTSSSYPGTANPNLALTWNNNNRKN
jgi:hypothetical protein